MPVSIPPKLPLSDAELAHLCERAKILEQDGKGIKVLRLKDGNFLKFFRVKRWWSSAQLYAYSRHFCRNAVRLARIDVPTMVVLARYKCMQPGLTCVLYQPLQGRTLRQIAQTERLDSRLLEQFGAFVARLHRQGIYFRSLHLGNIILTPSGNLGLIDIADLSIFPWPLSCHRRLRNFRHLWRIEADRLYFDEDGWRIFCDAYLKDANKSENCRRKLAGGMQQLLNG